MMIMMLSGERRPVQRLHPWHLPPLPHTAGLYQEYDDNDDDAIVPQGVKVLLIMVIRAYHSSEAIK